MSRSRISAEQEWKDTPILFPARPSFRAPSRIIRSIRLCSWSPSRRVAIAVALARGCKR
jgi:hypothetical protein